MTDTLYNASVTHLAGEYGPVSMTRHTWAVCRDIVLSVALARLGKSTKIEEQQPLEDLADRLRALAPGSQVDESVCGGHYRVSVEGTSEFKQVVAGEFVFKPEEADDEEEA